MAPLSQLNEGLYDDLATQITYCKLFPLIMEDFLTRSDCKDIMTANNLIVNTAVTGSLTGGTSVTGKGTGIVSVIYNGAMPNSGSIGLKAEKEAIKNAGGVSDQVIGSV